MVSRWQKKQQALTKNGLEILGQLIDVGGARALRRFQARRRASVIGIARWEQKEKDVPSWLFRYLDELPPLGK